MTDTTDMTIVKDLLAEVKGYLPEMQSCLEVIAADKGNAASIKELHRMTHTICGVAAMVQLTELSGAASVMENALDAVMDGTATMTSEHVEVFDNAVKEFGNYCTEMENRGTEIAGLSEKVRSSFAALDQAEPEDVDSFFDSLDDNDETLTDDFFQQLEKDESSLEDELPSFFDELDKSSKEAAPDSGTKHSPTATRPEEDVAQQSFVTDDQDELDSSVDQELLECFYEEVEEHLENMGDQLNQLAEVVTSPVAKSASHRDNIHSLRRSVHTMKGAAAVIGIESVAEWGHEFEDFLDWLHDEADQLSPDMLSVLFAGADLLEKISAAPDSDFLHEKEQVQAQFLEFVNAQDNTSQPNEKNTVDEDVSAELDTLLAVAETSSLFDDSSDNDDFIPAIDEELLECFREEVEEHLENIGEKLNTLSSQIVKPVGLGDSLRETLHSLRRSVHTMKGAAAVIGIEPVAEWGHEFEDFLDWLHDESDIITPDIVSAMHDGADLLESIASSPDDEFGRERTATKDTFLAIIASRGHGVTEEGISEVVEFTSEQNETAEQSQAIATELLEIFEVEAEEHLENIGRKLNVLVSSVQGSVTITTDQRAALHSLRRSVHDLKGAASVVGIKTVAEWGHTFENFLGWLRDEGQYLSSKVSSGLLEGADILEQLAEKPDRDFSRRIEKATAFFQGVMEDRVDLDEHQLSSTAQDIKRATELPQPVRGKTRKTIRKRTLRVGADKIDEVMGLSDDIAINLSSSEDSMQNMQLTLEDLRGILHRLQGISSSLEAGYELATIPHFGTPTQGNEEEQGIIEEFDPLEMDRYSELNVLIRSLNESVVDLDALCGQASEVHNSWRTNIELQRKMLTELQGKMKGVQMTPFSTLANRLYRTVRESARVTGKSVRLTVEGGNIEMDSYVWDIMADPLMHMLRNSVDHGVEDKEERLQNDKPAQATIRIQCFRRGNQFALKVSDDGRGLDLDSIRKRAITLYPDLDVDKLNERELAGLIFRQGFSIRTQVTQMSGRGVGMDVVSNAVDILHGTIEVTTVPNKGAEFLFLLPITVAQLPALLVRFGQQQFAVPMRDITRVLRLNKEDIHQETIDLAGDVLPLMSLEKLLGLRRTDRFVPGARGVQQNFFGIAVKAGGKRGVLVAEEILGNRELVFKNLGSHLSNVPCVAGVTIMGDGSLVPILHTEDVFSREELTRKAGKFDDLEEISPDERVLTILAVDDSISIRKVLKKFIIDQGWHPVLGVDGVDGMEKIRESQPDLVLLDVEMPRMNGFEVLQFLQSHNEFRNIPVLMLTSRSAEKYKNKAEQLGAQGFVTKPFHPEKLASLIIEHTGKG